VFFLLTQFLRHKKNVDKLADFYFNHEDQIVKLKNRFPDWEVYVNQYLSAKTRASLRERGIPL